MSAVVLRFDLPSGEVLYAGTLGVWQDEKGARTFDSPEEAAAFLAEHYGHSAKYGVIVEVTTEKVEQ